MSKEIPKFIKYVAIDPKTASDLCNEVYPDKPETVGNIFKDYVNFFLYEDDTLVETKCDRYEHFARNQLADDAIRLRAHAKDVSDARAIAGSKGGKSKAESKDDAADHSDSNYPDEMEVIDYIRAKEYDGNIAGKWLDGMISCGWKDEQGNPIRNWRKRLDAYMRKYNKNRMESMANGMFKG